MNHIYIPLCNFSYPLVPTGGFLFEYFMWTCSGYSSHRRFCKLCSCVDDNSHVQHHEERELVSDNLTRFVGWLLFHLSSIGSNGRRQLFYITFLNRYYGLSRNGVDNLCRFGYGLNNTMMDEMTQDSVVKSQVRTKYVQNVSLCMCYSKKLI